MDVNEIIIEPVLSEKTNGLRDQNKYVFKVDGRANKIEIKQAVRELFSVHPLTCRIINVKRKPKRLRYQKGYTSQWKKAVITVASGEKIDIFEGA
jgi:large subunit ribosomal protein L23